MLVLFSLILLVIWAALIGGIYAMFNPFIEQLWSIQHYNIAYYGAVSSLERSYLVLRWHQAGFEWEWWWGANNSNYGPNSDWYEKDNKVYWGIMSVGDNGQKWEIKNMIPNGTTVPLSGNGNIDTDMAANDSFGFNKLEFGNPIEIALYKDSKTWIWDYYKKTDSVDWIDISSINVSMRLPPKIKATFWGDATGKLTVTNTYNGDADGDGIWNDTVAIWSLFGIDTHANKEFTIVPRINVNYTNSTVSSKDSSIRENIINSYSNTNPDNINFWNSINPVNGDEDDKWQYLIPNDLLTGATITPNGTGTTFSNIFLENKNGDISKLHLKFSLANILKSTSNQIYPYLEVKIDAGTEIPDLYYHITAESTIWKYNVKILKDKPLFESSEAGDYVILF